MPPVAAAAIVAALVLYGRISARVGDPPELYIADVWVALTFPLVGAWLVARELRQRVGYVLLGTSACYMLPMVQRILFNRLDREENRELVDLGGRERAILVPALALILLIGVYPTPFLERTSASVEALLVRVEARTAPPTPSSATLPPGEAWRPTPWSVPAGRTDRTGEAGSAPGGPAAAVVEGRGRAAPETRGGEGG